MRPSKRLHCAAFTLVELLVVIAIIGVLVALLLPAIQAARESARRTQCTSQLKELATGCMNHESAMRHFPTGGWGWSWVGDADRGYGRNQPGGWIYNILPFIEQRAKHDLPKDGQPDQMTDSQLEGARQMLLDPVTIIYCPTRRNGRFTNSEKPTQLANNAAPNPPNDPGQVGRSDYAANAGDDSIGGGVSGPGAGYIGNPVAFHNWLCVNTTGLLKKDENPDGNRELTGISFQRSEIAIKHITDGSSNTYLAGEKFLIIDAYETGEDTGDNETWCTGHNNDNLRTTAQPPQSDIPAIRNGKDIINDNGNIFGSAHPTGWNVAWCDGHVQYMSFDIDPLVHRYKGNRSDGISD